MNQQKIDQLTERILNETLSAISSSLLISNDYLWYSINGKYVSS